jgi:hypothetical protein
MGAQQSKHPPQVRNNSGNRNRLRTKLQNTVQFQTVIVEVFQKKKAYFKKFLALEHEVGGDFNLATNELTHTMTSDGLTLENSPHYPESWGLICWHTHPSSVAELLKSQGAKEPFEGIPSNRDITTALRASLFYEETSIAVIVSKYGFCIYYPNAQLMNLLLSETEEERERDIEKVIDPNLSVIYGKVFMEPQTNPVKVFIEEMKYLTNPGEGFVIEFYPWK